MPKKSRKNITFDAMVKFFLKRYQFPTKKDIENLAKRMDRLEKLIRKSVRSTRGPARIYRKGAGRGAGESSASGVTLKIIKDSKKGARFSDIRDKTGFDEKKVRNIIYRLHKLGKIKRKMRGVYVAKS